MSVSGPRARAQMGECSRALQQAGPQGGSRGPCSGARAASPSRSESPASPFWAPLEVQLEELGTGQISGKPGIPPCYLQLCPLSTRFIAFYLIFIHSLPDMFQAQFWHRLYQNAFDGVISSSPCQSSVGGRVT